MPGRDRPAWLEHVVRSRAQTLEDVALAQMATVAVISGDEGLEDVVDALTASALEAGFAVAGASLAHAGLHELDEVVGALAASLRVPGGEGGRRHGLLAALDAFAERHRKGAEPLFEEQAEQEGLTGELRALAREYLAAANDAAKKEARRIQAWLGGRDVRGEAERLPPLAARTARRALAQLTRLVRALGHRGLRMVLRDAEALVDLPPGRRDVAYTVLRELVDNVDGGYGMVGCEVLIVGSRALETRVHTLTEHPALAMRIETPGAAGLPLPHQSWIRLDALVALGAALPAPPEPRPVEARRAPSLRALVRIAQGLPPHEASVDLTVGMEQVDARIEQLFETASHDGSVFAVLSGEYGAGKTRHLLHLEARALDERRPVLRLAVERLDQDLGNPQRHLRRLLEAAIVPTRQRRTGALERLEAWLDAPRMRKRLHEALAAIAASESEAARAALRALRAARADFDEAHVREVLGALDLVDKPNNPWSRKDAYARLQLWIELLRRLEDCEGPVVILDEAENLYRAGVSRPERRTGLRSLAFYCGGALPRACVVLAVTPETLDRLREEAGELLDEIQDQAGILEVEDVAMLRRRLLRARPIPVTKLGRDELVELAERARRLAREVRGRHRDPDWEPFLAQALRASRTPRDLLRRVMAREERLAWLGEATG